MFFWQQSLAESKLQWTLKKYVNEDFVSEIRFRNNK